MKKRPCIKRFPQLLQVLASFFLAVSLLLQPSVSVHASEDDISLYSDDIALLAAGDGNGADIYTYFVYNGYTLYGASGSSYTGDLYSFRTTPSRCYEYGTYDLYSKDGSYLGQKKVYIWFSSVSDYSSAGSYLFADRPWVDGASGYPSDATKQAQIYSIQYSTDGTFNSKPAIGIDYIPTSTGMSYSEPVDNVYVNSMDVTFSGSSLSGASYGMAYATVILRLSNPLPTGSYFIPLYRHSGTPTEKGSYPSIYHRSNNYSLFHIGNYGTSAAYITAVGMNYDFGRTNFYVDVVSSSLIISFDMFFYVNQDFSGSSYSIVYDVNGRPLIYKADSNALIENNNQNAQDIMHSYDSSAQQSDNERFESSRQELQEEEDSLFGDATSGFDSLDMSEFGLGKFSQMQGAFSFVSGFLQSLYVKMGAFGSIVTVGLVLMIATKVIGLFRFQVVDHS